MPLLTIFAGYSNTNIKETSLLEALKQPLLRAKRGNRIEIFSGHASAWKCFAMGSLQVEDAKTITISGVSKCL